MPIPVPNIKPLQIPNGVAHYKYLGPIGTLGPVLTIDLTAISDHLRSVIGFREQLYVTLQALLAADGIVIDPASIVVLPAAPALPEYAQLVASATNAAGLLQVLVETHHSVGR
jgi:hypothetical protein